MRLPRVVCAPGVRCKIAAAPDPPLRATSSGPRHLTPNSNGRLPLAQGATIHQFEVQLSNVDRGVYEAVVLRIARHPSENEEFMCARVLAFCLEHQEGLAFSKGLAEPDQPALEVRDLTGGLRAWIEVGAPDAARLHRASKSAPRVAVYTHTDPDRYWASLAGERIHRAESLELYGLDRALVAALVARLDRRMTMELSITEGALYMTHGGELLTGELRTHRLVG
jgi:uncharacterized protein YaeQ